MNQNLWRAMAISFALFATQVGADDGHCLVTTSQTSVDINGRVIRTTCQPLVNLDAKQVAKEKKRCEKGARKNRAKAWLEGQCPTKDRISTCTIKKIGPATLPQPRIVHTYSERSGNLDRRSQIELARQQCAQMGLGSGEFKAIEPDEETAPLNPSAATAPATSTTTPAATSDSAATVFSVASHSAQKHPQYDHE